MIDNTFKYVTVPTSIASVGVAIVAAELVSPVVMAVAAGIGAVSVVSALASRFTSNGHVSPKDTPANKPPVQTPQPEVTALHR